jgi:hypothetical protein
MPSRRFSINNVIYLRLNISRIKQKRGLVNMLLLEYKSPLLLEYRPPMITYEYEGKLLPAPIVTHYDMPKRYAQALILR